MKVDQLFAEQRKTAFGIVFEAAEASGRIIFPKAELVRPDSTGGILSIWIDITGDGDWRPRFHEQIGEIVTTKKRDGFKSAVLFDHHAAVKNTDVIAARRAGRTDAQGRVIIASSQIADERPEDPLAKRYGGNIICCGDRAAISFSGLYWKWDEVMAADVAYRLDQSITAERVRKIIEVSDNEHLEAYAAEHFRFAA